MLQGFSERKPGRPDLMRLRGPAMVLSLILAWGCGARDPTDRQPVSGVVTLDGRPLDDGAILLEPLDQGGRGTFVGATIRRGSFAIERDQGPTPGPYRVRIYSSAGVQAPPAGRQTERTRRPMVERVPGIYNTRSALRIDVVAGARNRWRLDLQGSDSPVPGGSPR